MKQAIVVFSRPGVHWNPEKPNRAQAYWDDHARFMDALFDAGKVILGGPFADGSGSMVILSVESVDVARAIFQDDPWAHHGILVADEIKEWAIFLNAFEKVPG